MKGGESRICKDEDPESGTFFEDKKKGEVVFLSRWSGLYSHVYVVIELNTVS